jgi:hypothetical protein
MFTLETKNLRRKCRYTKQKLRYEKKNVLALPKTVGSSKAATKYSKNSPHDCKSKSYLFYSDLLHAFTERELACRFLHFAGCSTERQVDICVRGSVAIHNEPLCLCTVTVCMCERQFYCKRFWLVTSLLSYHIRLFFYETFCYCNVYEKFKIVHYFAVYCSVD